MIPYLSHILGLKSFTPRICDIKPSHKNILHLGDQKYEYYSIFGSVIELLPDFSHASICSISSEMSLARNPHSQTVATRQPARMSASMCDIAGELDGPEVSVAGRSGRQSAVSVTMPEAPMHENDGPIPRQNQIGLAGQRFDVEAVPEAQGMEFPSQAHFRAGVFPPNSAHHS
jgi:hypothetical protein